MLTRQCGSGPGESATEELPESRRQHSVKGTVKVAARPVPAVSSSAKGSVATYCMRRVISEMWHRFIHSGTQSSLHSTVLWEGG